MTREADRRAVDHCRPEFSSQTKDKLVSEVKGIVESIVAEKLGEFLLENPGQARAIVAKTLDAARRASGAQGAHRVAKARSTRGLPGKLADCEEKDPASRNCFSSKAIGRRLGKTGPRPARRRSCR
jgi:DNA gyrase subunit B